MINGSIYFHICFANLVFFNYKSDLTLKTKMYDTFLRFRDAKRSENLGGDLYCGVKNLRGGEARAGPKSYFPTF